MTTLYDGASTTATVGFARDLVRFGDRTALITAQGAITYRELDEAVAQMRARLGHARRLVALKGTNTGDAIVGYLAALSGGHPLLLVPGDQPASAAPHGRGGLASVTQAVIDAYDPDVVIDGQDVIERHLLSQHELHPELALLLSTSGSTGSPKLVRLSHDNLVSNAEAIAEYLDIRDSDRAATTLPMHYCYGLSVINSQLARGAGLILTDLSVSDPRFWELFVTRGGTSFAGVPYTFDLLERAGFAEMRVPGLRYVTQAGGRLEPSRVKALATLGQRDGWRLFVMYGQTEATARMAYLPPELAVQNPGTIGVPIPGGSFRIAPEEGELVYSGPNVMLGYATRPADLALGRTVHELPTGDLARQTPEGLYEIVGRRSRFAKCFGLRIDLDRVEAELRQRGIDAYCAGDEELVIAVSGGAHGVPIKKVVGEMCGLPAHAIRVVTPGRIPRLGNGKPDYAAIARLAEPQPVKSGATSLVRLYAEVLGYPDVTEDDTFTGLGGDSLSYVQMCIRLESALGHLPAGWQSTPIRELKAKTSPRVRRIDTSIALRALSIVLIVGTHASLFPIAGGAHLLLGVAGFNFGRFQVTASPRLKRVAAMATSVRRVALASIAWIGLMFLLTNEYSLKQVFLVNYLFGRPKQHNDFWFIETLVYILLAMIALMAVPWFDRAERRYPFTLPVALMLGGLVTRYDLIPGVWLPTPLRAFWLFALGWATAKAATAAQRRWVTLFALATVPGFFGGDVRREAIIVAGLILLIWFPTLPSTQWANRIAGILAGASLYIYLTHWRIFPLLHEISPFLAVLASLAVGIGYAHAIGLLRRLRPVVAKWAHQTSPSRQSHTIG